MNVSKDALRAREAAEWYMALQGSEISPENLQRWNEWSRVAANQQAFDSVARISQLAVDLRGMAMPTDAELAKNRASNDLSVRSRWSWLAAAALIVAVAILIPKVARHDTAPPPITAYETQAHEHRSVALSDGSTVTLGAKTSISTGFSSSQRSVVLERGEALFQVARDPNRPFTVIAGGGTITALGTVFNVNREDDRVVVRVAEGKVRVTQSTEANEVAEPSLHAAPHGTTLHRGEQVTYGGSGNLSPVAHFEPEATAVWREGRLQYRDEQLKYVAADVNRYSGKRLLFGDRAAESLLYTGTVYQDRIDEWLQGLENLYPVTVVQTDASHVLVRSTTKQP